MNHLAADLPRRVDWFHVPVPRAADPERYLAPYGQPSASARGPSGPQLIGN